MKHTFGFLPVMLIIAACSAPQQALQTTPVQHNSHPDLTALGDGWYDVSGRCPIENITPERAREEAILRARKAALEHFSGVEVRSTTLMIRAEGSRSDMLDAFSSLSSQTSRGIITSEEILGDESQIIGNSIQRVVRLKLKAEKQSGTKDPYFTLDAKLNRDHFKSGEQMEISVRSSQDCYITILNICSDNNVYVLLPNQYIKTNYLKNSETLNFPGNSPINTKVQLLPGKNEDTEMIKVIATRQPVQLFNFENISVYGTAQTALPKLQKWLLDIPRNEYEEADLQYFIHK